MIVSIHQPDFIPWLGFYYKVMHSDCFVYLDDAQFSNEAAHNFNDIKTPQGKFRLKVPVDYKFGDSIKDVTTKDSLNWKAKHLKTIEMNYTKAIHFKETFPIYEEVLNKNYKNISEMNITINNMIFKNFGIDVPFSLSSELGLDSNREERVIDICVANDATEYLSGNGARVYQDERNFLKRGIILSYLDYKPIEYRQLWRGFFPCMSVIDYIFNYGFDWDYVENAVKALNGK